MRQASIGQAFALLPMLYATQVAADATLVYTFTEPDGSSYEKTLSIARFWTRVDDPREEGQFLLYQAGKFFPLYRVDTVNQTYTLLTPPVTPTLGPATRTAAPSAGDQADAETGSAPADEPAAPDEKAAVPAAPEAPAMQLKPTKEKRTIAGVECRVITEVVDGEPVMEHCMANTPRLGTTNRELITLARFFDMAREKDLGWWGIGSHDEQFVAVQSRDLATGRTQELKSVSRAPLPPDHLRVPRTFTEVTPSAEAPAETPAPAEPAP